MVQVKKLPIDWNDYLIDDESDFVIFVEEWINENVLIKRNIPTRFTVEISDSDNIPDLINSDIYIREEEDTTIDDIDSNVDIYECICCGETFDSSTLIIVHAISICKEDNEGKKLLIKKTDHRNFVRLLKDNILTNDKELLETLLLFVLSNDEKSRNFIYYLNIYGKIPLGLYEQYQSQL